MSDGDRHKRLRRPTTFGTFLIERVLTSSNQKIHTLDGEAITAAIADECRTVCGLAVILLQHNDLKTTQPAVEGRGPRTQEGH